MPPVISNANLPAATRGVAYSATLLGSYGTLPYYFGISEGFLPPGLSLNTSTGAITGTPLTAGYFSPTFYVGDATNSLGYKQLTIAVGAGATGAALNTPFNENNLIPYYYDKPPKDWDEVTVEHIYQDESASYNANNSNAPQIFEYEFTGLSKTELQSFVDHYNAARGKLFDFPFTDRYGTFYASGTRYLKFNASHDGNKSWRNRVKVTLIRRP